MGSLYEQDFIAWTEQQSRVLRGAAAAGTNLPLDWEQLAEEIEDLGKSARRALGSELRRIIQHLLKLEIAPARDPRAVWKTSIVNARAEIDGLLASDPGLQSRLGEVISDEAPRAAKAAAQELQAYGETAAADAARHHAGGHTQAQILDDWFPGDPAL